MKNFKLLLSLMLIFTLTLTAQNTENYNNSPFKQLYEELPTPGVYRTASGAPGHAYWQQQADYKMKLNLDDEKQVITGDETITYTNNSPDELEYLWVQLDQNVRAQDSDSHKISSQNISQKDMTLRAFNGMFKDEFDGGFKIDAVTKADGSEQSHLINKTMMRINLDEPLKPGKKYTFGIKWHYNVNDRMEIGGRSGYEYFEEDGNYLYTIAQFFPRMCVYNDVDGWQNKQFLGRGEFALAFGDYDVEITVPADHVVEATGELTNMSEVLTAEQLQRWEKAKTSDKPVFIITQEEAEANEKSRSKDTKTWKFSAKNVRDFGWVSSRKFIWDAQGVQFGKRTVMAESLYPKEGNPLWEMYSTKAVVLTLEVYSKHTFDYPYPKAISVHAADIGMEYPMICFNFGRPNKDGTYSDRTKYGMIGVIIHEVGHNYFPMIVNSDERQWTWMDEGLNTFCQYLTEKEWEDETGEPFQSRRGPADKIVDYMKGDKSNISPIMTNSESIHQFGANAYAKPATALNILRETIMGRELFDHAFKTYSQRWMFKHPTPADFFRSMEDASSVDLDWFWRGWFYTNDHCDLAIDHVKKYTLAPQVNEEGEFAFDEEFWEERDGIVALNEAQRSGQPLSKELKKVKKWRDKLKKEGKYNYMNKKTFDPIERWSRSKDAYKAIYGGLNEEEKSRIHSDFNFYEFKFSKVGGLVMPVIIEVEYTDGEKEIMKFPAEIWLKGRNEVYKVIRTEKEIAYIELDPDKETADTDRNNNYWPSKKEATRFQEFKNK